jgi:hypothetical protein
MIKRGSLVRSKPMASYNWAHPSCVHIRFSAYFFPVVLASSTNLKHGVPSSLWKLKARPVAHEACRVKAWCCDAGPTATHGPSTLGPLVEFVPPSFDTCTPPLWAERRYCTIYNEKTDRWTRKSSSSDAWAATVRAELPRCKWQRLLFEVKCHPPDRTDDVSLIYEC